MPIGLDHPDALDPERVGAKASRLAAASRAGISVLQGVVIEVAHSLPFLAAAARVALESGPAASQLAMMDTEVPPGLVDAVREAVDCEQLVVRSSSPLESAGEWSGTFASYVNVGPDDLETAIRGCWASMLGRDALARFDRLSGDPAAKGLAVLVQPAITPSPGGVAEADDESVSVTVADGANLAGLLQGWARGRHAELPRSGAPNGPAVETYGATLLERVGELARACRERTGDNHLEWAFADGHCYLLQARQARTPHRPRWHRATATLAGGDASRIARAVARYGGASGDELLLPWCFAPGGIGSHHQESLGCLAARRAPARLLGAASVRSAARGLTAQAWKAGEEEAAELARSALARLRDRLDPDALADLGGLAPVSAADGGLILATVEQAAAAAVADAQLFDPADAWRLPPALFDQLLDRAAVGGRETPGPTVRTWEPFLYEAVLANGQVHSGEPASEGRAAGRLLVLNTPRRLPGIRERRILHVTTPLPGYAPLLWGAAGLVSATGSASAHLFDVARTLGVPAVAGVDLASGHDSDLVVAVDGSGGEAVVL